MRALGAAAALPLGGREGGAWPGRVRRVRGAAELWRSRAQFLSGKGVENCPQHYGNTQTKQSSTDTHEELLGRVTEMKSSNHRFSMAAAESDKDSGYSDGSSECPSAMEQTDSEDVLNALCWNAEDGPWQCPRTTSSSFPALSPMVVMKNVLVKQVAVLYPYSISILPTEPKKHCVRVGEFITAPVLDCTAIL
ncbi:CLOCK-interacting pacemaker [Haemorhous mexicanus]|uniref:CLOCK-interacting pacemaker n=1 Tax=Haemorhous mexicanus TaxID=30427 RepID=UPI0028BE1CC1|nr:CLOCK-interacting pacemaker [Haemorhous mexicanus]